VIALILLVENNGFTQHPDTRVVQCIDQGWRFHFGHASDPARDFNYGVSNIFSKSGKADNSAIDPKFDDADWRTLDLPHDWAVELPFVKSDNPDVMAHGYKPVGGLFPETSVGWYRRDLAIMAADSGQRFFLRFDGVFRDASFWLNGFYLGTNESGYIGVSYDITDYVRFNDRNVLVVRVDATQYEGWFYEGAGIYRHVWLTKSDPLHLVEDGIQIQSTIRGNQADIRINGEIRNDGQQTKRTIVTSFITDQSGTVVAYDTISRDLAIAPQTTHVINTLIKLTGFNPWSLINPHLYRLHLSVAVDGRVTDSRVTRFGIRDVRFDAEKGFFLNGEPMKILGVNCHQDHAGVGMAYPDNLHFYRIRLLKEMGVNAYRASHNPPAPELLDACDSLGMVVVNEHRLLNSSPEYESQLTRLIRRDRNHPSVILWSIGNEEGLIQTNGNGKRIALSLMAIQQRIDPSRTSTYAADLPNIRSGINEVIPIRSFNYRQFAVADYHISHPDQPILGTEMGSTVTTRGELFRDTIRCYLPDQDITAPWWASTAETWWQLCSNQPWWMGGFIWTGFDYRGEPTPFSWPNINSHFGIMDMCGFPKNIYYYYKSWWSNDDVLHISPHWNLDGKVKPGENVKVWVNSNAEVVELFLNGKSLGRKIMPRNGHLDWEVPYHPGKLSVTGYRNGKDLSNDIETTGKPHKIKLLLDSLAGPVRAGNAVVVNVVVMDSEGRMVPDAGNQIQFSVQGNVKIIGAGNGDPSSHESDQPVGNQIARRLFNGKCQIILQVLNQNGDFELIAKGDGLLGNSMKIRW
jgi:beta-galactosidase